jgi:cyclopropane fatty-acyl-phospholipid synthase-like methyltransferase
MNPFYVLRSVGQLPKRDWRVLDVGCRDGRTSEMFASHGCDVTGIDVRRHDVDLLAKGINFILSSLEEFHSDKPFDFIMARHVLPFAKGSWDDRMANVTRLMLPGACVFLTVFTHEDGFEGETGVLTIDSDEFEHLLKRHHLKVRYRSHEQFEGPKYDGTRKNWDIIGVLAELPS